jgi:hypothetical protein
VEKAPFLNADGMGSILAGHILRVLEKPPLSPPKEGEIVSLSFGEGWGEAYVLIHLPAQSCCHYLYAATDAQYRDLAAECFEREEEFGFVALGANTMKLWQRFFAKEEWIDVAASRENDTVEGFEQGKKLLLVAIGRNDNRRAPCLEDRKIIAFGQLAAFVAEVACNADNRSLHDSSRTVGFVSAR